MTSSLDIRILPPLLSAVITMFAVPGTAVVAQATAVSASQPSDPRIRDAIEDELLHDHAVPARLLRVEVADGVVTLAGTSDNILAAERAVAIARTIRGVRAVVDRIAIEPGRPMSPSELQDSVARALRGDPATDTYEVRATVQPGGSVHLEGRVQSWAERALCQKVVEGVAGVRAVDNAIVVDFTSARSDEEIRDEVAQRLHWDILIDDNALQVACDDGIVAIDGRVGSAAERFRVGEAAWVAGVADVDVERVRVEPRAADPMQRSSLYAVRSPEQIRAAVQDALRHDPRVAEFEIDVTVDLDEVTLRGTVDNLKAARAAASDAMNAVGVSRVVSRLEVVPNDRRSTAAMVADVERALRREPFVDASDIRVFVVHGVARLRGRVDSNFERARADDAAARVAGIVDVQNHLVVRDDAIATFDPYIDASPIHQFGWYRYEMPLTFASDEDIERRVGEELWWSPFVTAADIEVEVENGVVTLTGNVANRAARQVATKNAFDGGAIWVQNRLSIDARGDVDAAGGQ